MILTVTLNTAVDKTYCVENFALDRVHRPSDWRIVAGGKGINVARVFRTLGGQAIATGYLGGNNGRFIAEALRQEGIPGAFVRTRDESRVCIAVVDPLNRTQTEINEVGPSVRPREVQALKDRFRRLLLESRFEFVTLSGSVPPGVPSTVYADLLAIAREMSVRCALDASGEALKAGLAAIPWMAKPNIHELSDAVGHGLQSDREIIQAARGLLDTGIQIVCVTMGNHGGICVSREGVWKAVPPSISFASAVGSGDSFLAAFLWATEQGNCLPEALRLAIGAGTANAVVYGAGFCTKDDMLRICERVQVRKHQADEVRDVVG